MQHAIHLAPYWKNPDIIEANEIPLPPKEIDRYDLISFLGCLEIKEQLKAFASDIEECDKNYALPIDNSLLKKVVLHTSNLNQNN